MRDSLKFACALEEHHVPIELHLFSHAQHDFSTADDTSCEKARHDSAISQWMPLSIDWLKRNFLQGELGRPVEKGKYLSKY